MGAGLINGGGWVSDSPHYSASYLVTKYLETKLTGSMADLMSDIKAGVGFATAVTSNTAYASLAAFATDFSANGAAYYASLDLQGLGVAETDVGAISGSDHGGGAQSSSAVVPSGTYSDNPTNFNVIMPTISFGGLGDVFMIGANAGAFISFSYGGINSTSKSLGLDSIDLVKDASGGIGSADLAISKSLC